MGKKFKLKLKVVYTDGRQPVGNGVGPVLEMQDILSVLQNLKETPQDLREKSLFLSTELIRLCGIKNARKKAEEALCSGKAYEKFKEIKLSDNNRNTVNWLMGQVHKQAIGNVEMNKLSEEIEKIVQNNHKKD